MSPVEASPLQQGTKRTNRCPARGSRWFVAMAEEPEQVSGEA